ncbi:Pectinesterase inhibitor domain [Dillenia turbinata]|uniref:Pectinesterase inhibitor domain n=1 Tax=Dillenia turbinata TaxID=194707 RepID=A0AAN8WB62_9MAGN
MAFQEFSHFTERRKAERREKLRKRITIAVASSVVLLGLIAAGCFAVVKVSDSKAQNNNNNNAKPATKEVSRAAAAIKLICNGTDYKQSCENSLSEVAKSDPSLSQPKSFVKAAISDVEAEVQKASNETSAFNFDTPEEKAAYEDCKVLLQDAMDELKESLSRVALGKLSSASDDLNNWLSAVMSYLHTCIDGFPEGNMKTSMQKALKSGKELTSNGLAIVSQVSSVLKTLQLPTGTASRRLLAKDGFPQWLSHDDRRMLKARKIEKTPNVIVAKDGSGNFTTISDALAAMPDKYEGRYLIYVKEGVYEETVIINSLCY